MKIEFEFVDRSGTSIEYSSEIARGLILRDEGVQYLQGANFYSQYDLTCHLHKCDDEFVPTVIEAMAIGLREAPYLQWGTEQRFASNVRSLLREYRVKYDLVEGQIVPLESLELHEGVVVPTLTLLAGRNAFAGAEKAYRGALKEISKGRPADAITDSGTALQEALTALGCEGNALGSLIKSAKAQGIFASHDKTLTEGIEKMLHWVSADRSEKGDSHKVVDVQIEDAWLTLHVVGALIVRLSEKTKRDE